MRRALRHLLLPAALVLSAIAGGATWLATSEGGLRAAARLAEEFSGGQLQLENVSGALAGPFAIGTLRFVSPAREIAVAGLRVDWRPAALWHGQLAIDQLRIDALRILPGAAQAPEPPPASLQLPLAVAVRQIEISRIVWGSVPLAADLSARLESDGRRHRLDALQGRIAEVDIHADAKLDGAAPFLLDARIKLRGRLAERPLAVALTAAGPLAELPVSAIASEGVDGRAEATLTPFAETPLSRIRLSLQNLDPAAWQTGAPSARISISAEVVPRDDGFIGSFGLTNLHPGRFDAQRLPVETVAGQVDWRAGQLRLAPVHARLPGQGVLAGSIDWQATEDGTPAARIALTATHVDAAQLHGALRPTQLAGPITATVSGERQQAHVDLRDAAWRIFGDLARHGPQVTLTQAGLAAGEARITGKGELRLDGERPFSAEGELFRLDPSRFARLPKALLNARFTANGRLGGARHGAERRVEGRFTLADSQLAGQPLTGLGQLRLDGPRLTRLDLHLAAGPNRLDAAGAFGRPEDTLEIAIDAPRLDGYGLAGNLRGRLTLAGALPQARIAAQFEASRFGLPGRFELHGLSASADVAPQPAAPLRIDLRLAALDLPERPAFARALRLTAAGSQREHRIDLSGALPADTRLTLAASGGLDPATGWQGKLLEARLDGNEAGRHARLSAPAPLAVGRERWRIGPLALAGQPLDWRATLEAAADDGRLTARLAATGSRIGRLDGELSAGLSGPWTLDRNASWRGQLTSEIADLGWLADIAGKDWQTAGRVDSRLRMAGTPASPRLDGHLRGERLALRLPVQGLDLADGTLDVDLNDNLLHINRAAFASRLQPLPRALRLAGGNELTQALARPGRLEISGEMRLDRNHGESAALDVRLERLGIFQTPDQWIALSGDGSLGWREGTLTVRGTLAADAGYWQLAPAGMPQLSDDVVVRRADEARARGLGPKLDLELTTGLGRHFLFSGAGLSAQLAGEVRLSAHGQDLPRASGAIRAREGRFEAYGQQLDIERGILNFNGLLNNPTLDIRAVRRGLAVTPGVQIGGTAQKPVVRLVSEPELPEAEKLSWLVLGHGPEQLGVGDAATLLSAAGGLLGNNAGGVVQQIKKNFGLDEFGVRQGRLGDIGRPQTSRVAGSAYDTTGATGSQIFSVGKQLTQTARLSYEQALGKAESIVKLTVNLTRQVSVIGRAGSDNALDLFYTLVSGRSESPPAKPVAKLTPP